MSKQKQESAVYLWVKLCEQKHLSGEYQTFYPLDMAVKQAIRATLWGDKLYRNLAFLGYYYRPLYGTWRRYDGQPNWKGRDDSWITPLLEEANRELEARQKARQN